MKNIIKKVSAIAMAFSLLGTGSAISKVISPDTQNSYIITAEAAKKHKCWDSVYTTYTESIYKEETYWDKNGKIHKEVTYKCVRKYYCNTCHNLLRTDIRYRTVKVY